MQPDTHSQPPFADLRGLRAVVTGGSSGIGRAIALELARAGADVAIHFAVSRARAEAVQREVQAYGVQCELFQADLETADCALLARQCWESWGPCDIWINNAGVDLLTGPGRQWTYAEKLRKLLAIDVTGTVLLSRTIGALMQERVRCTPALAGQSSIVNIGWDQADRGMEGDSGELFSVAKNAIMGFTRSLAVSLAPEVRVNCIAPGWIKTAWGETAPPEWQARVLRETPLRRWGEPTDIARLARYLVSREASYLTGQVLNANGGAIR
jgi:3-oxoacyl-[acyl-carrier protein] reductase